LLARYTLGVGVSYIFTSKLFRKPIEEEKKLDLPFLNKKKNPHLKLAIKMKLNKNQLKKRKRKSQRITLIMIHFC